MTGHIAEQMTKRQQTVTRAATQSTLHTDEGIMQHVPSAAGRHTKKIQKELPTYLWQEHLPCSKQISHHLHAVHQGALDDVKGSSVALNLSLALFHILHHILLYSLTATTQDATLQEKRDENGNR